MSQTFLRRHRAFLTSVALLAILLVIYLPTLQTIPNGSEHYYMIDVGETQIVLNVWGTLHATGYPLYVIAGSAIVAVLRGLGISPVTAPALVSLIWGLAALTLFYALLVRLTKRVLLSAMAVLLFGLMRTVWIHHAIAEIYTFGLLIGLGLLALALWQPPVKHRLYWLALLGGLGVAHHRAIAMMIPALLFAVYPDFRTQGRKLPRTLVICLLLGLIGFLPYAYLMLRANAGAAWVYGSPGTLAGLWDQFTGREAARFIGAPGSLEAFFANVNLVNNVLVTDATLPGILAGIAGLILGSLRKERRTLALTMILSGLAALLFHYVFYTDILSALILPVLLSVAAGWLLLADALIDTPRLVSLPVPEALGVVAAAFAVALFNSNHDFIQTLTTDPTGQETIALAQETPPGSALMLAWGPRHFAVGLARDVLGELPDVELVDHKTDFATLVARKPLVTPAFTFYAQPVSWWEAQLGEPVYLRTVSPDLVEIATAPEIVADAGPLGAQTSQIVCDVDSILLQVDWYTPTVPERDLSVFVHLLDASGTIIAQADQAAPVYGWRPLTTWQAGEIVPDMYALPNLDNEAAIRFGLYAQRADGSFENVIEEELSADCP
ncbi:MAG: DUF2723 domain-containing protein [Anaerolineae bacterium]|nr:DUF2723 domain-containing protein [Anaerolineae bacterium]